MERKLCEKCGASNLLSSKYCCECGYELPKIVVEDILPDEPAKPKRKPLSQIIGLVVGVVLAASVPVFIQNTSFFKPSIDKALVEIANELNKNLPMTIDEVTSLNNVLALPDKIIMYTYSVSFAKSEVDTLILKEHIEPQMINNAKTHPDMKYFRDYGVTMKYYYKDKDGNYLFSFTVTPEQYK